MIAEKRGVEIFVYVDPQKINLSDTVPDKPGVRQVVFFNKLMAHGSKERKRRLNERYPDDVVVLTKYWEALSWIVLQFYENESTSWLFNYLNKRKYFQDFGKALLAYQKNHPNDTDHIGICQAGITQAYSILTEGGDLHVK